MPAVTTDQGIALPVGTDLADVVAAMINQTVGVESRLNLRYANVADRLARHPVGIAGERSFLLAETRGDAHDGTNWISAAHQNYFARRRRTADATPIVNNTLVNDAVLVATLETNARFNFGGIIFYDASTVADFKLAFTWPAGVTARWGMTARNVATNTNYDPQSTTVSGTALTAGGNAVGTVTFVQYEGYLVTTGTGGNLQTQYAQNTTEATNMTVRAGSNLWVMREA
jgi:hypothetical protein